jgi:hypothetical protein
MRNTYASGKVPEYLPDRTNMLHDSSAYLEGKTERYRKARRLESQER